MYFCETCYMIVATYAGISKLLQMGIPAYAGMTISVEYLFQQTPKG